MNNRHLGLMDRGGNPYYVSELGGGSYHVINGHWEMTPEFFEKLGCRIVIEDMPDNLWYNTACDIILEKAAESPLCSPSP